MTTIDLTMEGRWDWMGKSIAEHNAKLAKERYQNEMECEIVGVTGYEADRIPKLPVWYIPQKSILSKFLTIINPVNYLP